MLARSSTCASMSCSAELKRSGVILWLRSAHSVIRNAMRCQFLHQHGEEHCSSVRLYQRFLACVEKLGAEDVTQFGNERGRLLELLIVSDPQRPSSPTWL